MRFNGVKCGLCPLVRSVEVARDEGWLLGVVDLCPVHSQSDGSDANTDLTQRALRPLCPQSADDPATVDGVAEKAQPRAGGSS